MVELVSKTYGEGLFKLALEENSIDVVTEEIKVVLKLLQENRDFIKLLRHPNVSKEDKIRMLETIFMNKLSGDTMSFLSVVIKNDRYDKLEKICASYLDLVKEYKKIGIVLITSALEISRHQKKKIEEKLLESTHYLQLETNYVIDKKLIGGIRIQFGDRVLDNSIKAKIVSLKKCLFDIQLAD